MSQKEIEVTVGSRSYRMAVDEAQEKRVKAVATHFDSYTEKLKASAPNMDRDRLLVLAGIMMADEFTDMVQEKEIETKTLEAFHNSMAERIEHMIGKK